MKYASVIKIISENFIYQELANEYMKTIKMNKIISVIAFKQVLVYVIVYKHNQPPKNTVQYKSIWRMSFLEKSWLWIGQTIIKIL